MRLQSHSIERRSQNRMEIRANWIDKMRRPAYVKLNLYRGDVPGQEQTDTLIHDDTKESADVMYALADIAWEMGWRPRGLAGLLAGMVSNYKIPPPE